MYPVQSFFIMEPQLQGFTERCCCFWWCRRIAHQGVGRFGDLRSVNFRKEAAIWDYDAVISPGNRQIGR